MDQVVCVCNNMLMDINYKLQCSKQGNYIDTSDLSYFDDRL